MTTQGLREAELAACEVSTEFNSPMTMRSCITLTSNYTYISVYFSLIRLLHTYNNYNYAHIIEQGTAL